MHAHSPPVAGTLEKKFKFDFDKGLAGDNGTLLK